MSASPALSQNYAPAIDQTSLLNMRFFDSGLFRFDDATVAFAPAGQVDVQAEVTDANGKSIAKLFFNGKMIAHSNRAQGQITAEHYKQSTHTFLATHETRRAHEAPPFTREKLANGNYNIRVERQSDGALLRNFAFTVANGQVQPIKRAVLGYQPHEDFVVPRVPVFGSSTYEFKQVIWINDPNR